MLTKENVTMFQHRLLFPLFYFLLVLIILPIFTSDKVFSLFYEEDSNRIAEIELIKREHRKSRVLQYLETLDPRSLNYHTKKLSEDVDNLIVILAKKPKHEEDMLLTQLVTEVDRNIMTEKLHKNAFFVCNVTRDNFEELDRLSTMYPVRQPKNTTKWKLFNKEEVIKHDFVECVSHALAETNAKHLTVIRDFVLPYSGFLEILNHLIMTRLNGTMSRGELTEPEKSWLFLHLQEPVPFRHYQLTGSCFHELLLISCAGGLVFLAVFWWVEDKRHHHQNYLRRTYILYGVLYFVTFALVIGRPYVSELRRLATALYRLYDPHEPVLFSAMSLPSSSANKLVRQLSDLRCSVYVPFHRVLDHMVNTLELPGYVISPSLFKYVARD